MQIRKVSEKGETEGRGNNEGRDEKLQSVDIENKKAVREERQKEAVAMKGERGEGADCQGAKRRRNREEKTRKKMKQ